MVNSNTARSGMNLEAGRCAPTSLSPNQSFPPPPPKPLGPPAKVVASAGPRLQIPLHHIEACYVRSHFSTMDVGAIDSPRPDELLYALVMSTGSRVHERLGGLRAENVTVKDGQR